MGLLDKLDAALGLAVPERKESVGSQIIGNLDDYLSGEAPHSSRDKDLVQAYRVHTWTHAFVRVIAESLARVPIRLAEAEDVSRGAASWKREKGIELWRGSTEAWLKDVSGELVEKHWLIDLLRSPFPEAGVTEYGLKQIIMTYILLAGNSYTEKVYRKPGDGEETAVADGWAEKTYWVKGKRLQGQFRVARLWPKIDPRNMWVVPTEAGAGQLIDGYVWRSGARKLLFDPEDIIHVMTANPESAYYGLSPIEVLRQSLIGDIRAADWNRYRFEHGAEPGTYIKTDKPLSPQQAEEIRQRWDSLYQGVRRSHRTAVLSHGTSVDRGGIGHRDMDFLGLRKWVKQETGGVLGAPLFLVGDRESLNRATSQSELKMFWENTVIPPSVLIEDQLNMDLVPKGEGVRLFFDFSNVEALGEDEERKAKIISMKVRSGGMTINDIRRARGEEELSGAEFNTVYMPTNMVTVGAPSSSEQGSAKAKTVEKDDALDVYLPPVDTSLQEAVHTKHLPLIVRQGAERGAEVLIEIGGEVPPDWYAQFNFQEEITRWMDEELAEAVGRIDTTTRTEARDIIRRGMNEGKGARSIARDLRGEFKGMEKWRSEMIARTEGGKAVSFGQHKLYTDTGVEKHGWLCQFVNSRHEHEDAHASYNAGIPINENFLLSDGTSMAAPRMSGVGKHDINCYCDEIPIVEGAKRYQDTGIKNFGLWLKSVEEEGEGAVYRKALAGFFKDEGERYIRHFLAVMGVS